MAFSNSRNQFPAQTHTKLYKRTNRPDFDPHASINHVAPLMRQRLFASFCQEETSASRQGHIKTGHDRHAMPSALAMRSKSRLLRGLGPDQRDLPTPEPASNHHLC